MSTVKEGNASVAGALHSDEFKRCVQDTRDMDED